MPRLSNLIDNLATEAAVAPVETITAFKGFDSELRCSPNGTPFQYEVGKTYALDGQIGVCSRGFHACLDPLDVWGYYEIIGTDGKPSRFAEVELSGATSKQSEGDSKIAAASITIKAELSLPEFIKRAVSRLIDMTKGAEGVTAASGYYSQLAASGHSSRLAASGYYSQLAASGSSSQLAASGDYSKLAASGSSSQLAASGDSSQLAASGYYSQLAASGHSSQLAASGHSSRLAASGYSSQLAASGHSSRLAASGDYSKLAASGSSSQLAASGDYSKLAASGDYSQLAASGSSSQLAASGDYSQLAASGDYSQLAASGDYSQLAASGYYSQLAASGHSSVIATTGPSNIAKGADGTWIAVAEFDGRSKCVGFATGCIGKDGLKPETWYRASGGKLVEAA